MECAIWNVKCEIWTVDISHNTKQIMFCLCLRWLGLGLGGLEPEAGWELGGGANMKKLYNFEYIWYTKILEYLFDKYRQIYIQACVS